ncbi:TlpA family protein disulfide reductase [Tamlana sp. I1]|uniref:TlpA family protein disulfide reductase n=1 Tax=Tamlana sp. I1 TaxID=2762061 RepID=UPI001E4A7758|nr:TlpA disulfide reductase family protein [Tamlana sp. I1]
MLYPSTISETKQQVLTDYNWQLQTKSGTLFNFENAKGKVVLVNFWATWCPPCIAEMPSLDALYSDYNDRVVFVFVSNESPEKINAFLKDKGYTFEPFTPLTQSPEFFNVTSIPRTFLIDKSGHVVIDKTGAANWNSDRVRNTIDALLSVDL